VPPPRPAGRASQAFPIEALSEPQPCTSLHPRAASKGHSGDTAEKAPQETWGLLTHNYPGHVPHGCSWSLIRGRTAYSGNLSVKHRNDQPDVRASLQGLRRLATSSSEVSLRVILTRQGLPQIILGALRV